MDELLAKLDELQFKQAIIIMDNVAFHKNVSIREEFNQENRILMFLPPYSPFLNPIENLFGDSNVQFFPPAGGLLWEFEHRWKRTISSPPGEPTFWWFTDGRFLWDRPDEFIQTSDDNTTKLEIHEEPLGKICYINKS